MRKPECYVDSPVVTAAAHVCASLFHLLLAVRCVRVTIELRPLQVDALFRAYISTILRQQQVARQCTCLEVLAWILKGGGNVCQYLLTSTPVCKHAHIRWQLPKQITYPGSTIEKPTHTEAHIQIQHVDLHVKRFTCIRT